MTDVDKNQILYVSPGYETIWGRSCESLYASPRTWMESIHPDDRERVETAMRSRQLSGGYDEEYRIVRPTGGIRWIRDRAYPIRESGGDVHRVVGTAADISNRKQAELRLGLQHAVTAVLAEATASSETNIRILETLGRGLQGDLAELWTVDATGTLLRCADVWHSPGQEFGPYSAASRHLTFEKGKGLPGSVWASGHAEWTADFAADPRYQRREHPERLSSRGWFGFPIKIRNETLGVVEVFSTRTTRRSRRTWLPC
jgi:PAS domain S-box-containing protein